MEFFKMTDATNNNEIIITNATELEEFLKQEKFILIGKTFDDKFFFGNELNLYKSFFHYDTKFYWYVFQRECVWGNYLNRINVKKEILNFNTQNYDFNFDFPTLQELKDFFNIENNPFVGKTEEKITKLLSANYCFLKDYTYYNIQDAKAIKKETQEEDDADISSAILLSKDFVNLDYSKIIEIFDSWQNDGWVFHTLFRNKKGNIPIKIKLNQNNYMQHKNYIDIDYNICRLPKLKEQQLTEQGLWELYGKPQEELQALGIKAKNPADDIKDWNVCIDFGTNSTVVAYEENGKSKLLRIGAKDFNQEIQAKDFENPTVLEFINFKNFIAEWNKTAYRPNVNWNDVKTSHEAKKDLELKENDSNIIASILTKIKQWAFQQDGYNYNNNDDDSNENITPKNNVLKITDQLNNFEYNIPPSITKNPVKGELLSVTENDILDPIELYAWFLGIAINWRKIGIFLRYYMTFPVKYPREVKDNILASFRRGIQRSLPESLVKQKQIFQKFSVSELASEPAAYAVAAMEQLNLIPDENNSLAYAVFDFGGGTTDFNFGYYRLPTEAEAETGCEVVFEHIGNEGDPFLGGENLVENLAYITFKNNKELMAKNDITFTKPIDAQTIPGCELLIDDSKSAKTNTMLLISRLRPLWETANVVNNAGIEKCKLLNSDGDKVNDLELTIPNKELQTYLQNRVFNGVKNFFTALHTAFSNYNNKNIPEQIHILLAGNSSKSQLVQSLFDFQNINKKNIVSNNNNNNENNSKTKNKNDNKTDDKNILTELALKLQEFVNTLFNNNTPNFIVHKPLAMDKNNIYAPTAKTGVALGLLKLCPGSPIDVKYFNQGNLINSQQLEQAAFIHYVGAVRLKKFVAELEPNCKYDEWKLLGIPRQNVFNLYHTQLAQAQVKDLKEGDEGLLKKRLELTQLNDSDKVFIRAVAPNKIEICTASKDNLPEANVDIQKLNNYQQIILQ